MRTRAAMFFQHGERWTVEDVELDGPRDAEVLVRLSAAGLCHSDEHLRLGGLPAFGFPVIGGHEGAGVVEKVGPNVTSVREGDHVVLSFIPACGRCPWCSRGHQNLCDLGAKLMGGLQQDDTSRHHVGDADARLMCQLGAFSPYTVCSETSVITIEPDIPLEIAALVGCGVATGWGTAVHTAKVQAGDTVVVMGAGGVGMNAVQGARMAGAENIVVLDPAPFKREQAPTFGATHAAATPDEALELVRELTRGVGAAAVLVTLSVPDADTLQNAMNLARKTGVIALTAMAPFSLTEIKLSLLELASYEKQIRGSLFGSCNPRYDVPRLLQLWRSGSLKLDELITRQYKLDDINTAYKDTYDGTNIRGVLSFT